MTGEEGALEVISMEVKCIDWNEGGGLEIFIMNNSFLFARYEYCQGFSGAENSSNEDSHK